MKTDHYTLQCLSCGKIAEDSHTGFLLTCPAEHPPSLLRAIYPISAFEIDSQISGIFRFARWLPVRRILNDADGPAVFHGKNLGKRLGLENLYFVFNGYWPEKGAFMETCTFKELEAPPVCARIPEEEHRTLVVSSAGNTSRAFLHICSQYDIPLVVVVPEAGLSSLWITRKKSPGVTLVALQGDADYLDAIRVGKMIAAGDDYFPEGGAQNVARRDGMGTVLLSFVEKTGRLPDHYFQAVGSGTGGIANWEMSRRLHESGKFGSTKMRLHLSQNIPFTPMVDAWNVHSRALLPVSEQEERERAKRIGAFVLSNRQPPYSLTGGVYDALEDSEGFMYAVSNDEANKAGFLFEREEGCDLDPAAKVAVASLVQAVERGTIQRGDLVALNITGGGYKLLAREKKQHVLTPDIVLRQDELTPHNVFARLHARRS